MDLNRPAGVFPTSYVITNLGNNAIGLGIDERLAPNGTVTIGFNLLNSYILAALNNGLISCTPDPRAGMVPAYTFAQLPAAGTYPGLQVQVTDVGVGGSLWYSNGAAWVQMAPVVLHQTTIPFISLGSGSVSAPGAITGIAALPQTYPEAWCYFPANILAAVQAAGWYYCTFSGVSTGTAYLNTYSGLGQAPTPGTLVPVTAGQGAFTGDTGEEFGPTVTINAGLLGTLGQLRISAAYEQTNNANVKTARVRYSGNAGTIFLSAANASLAANGFVASIANKGTVALQQSSLIANAASVVTQNVLGTVNSAAAGTLVASLQKATATDNLVLDSYTVELMARA